MKKKAEKFFSAFLFIMEEWSLFPKSHTAIAEGVWKSFPQRVPRQSPCSPGGILLYSAWAVRLEDVVLHSRLSSTNRRCIGYTDQKGFVLLGVGLSAAQDFVALR